MPTAVNPQSPPRRWLYVDSDTHNSSLLPNPYN